MVITSELRPKQTDPITEAAESQVKIEYHPVQPYDILIFVYIIPAAASQLEQPMYNVNIEVTTLGLGQDKWPTE